jgi:hypothetical protein
LSPLAAAAAARARAEAADLTFREALSRCGAKVAREDIETLLAGRPEDLARFRRFIAAAADPSQRECPRCDAGVAGGSAAAPALTCAQCGAAFCFLHATAHAPGAAACAAFAAEHAAEDAQNLAAAGPTKPCPSCGCAIGKDAGCNQIRCPLCAQCFCWLCGQRVDSSAMPAHFAWYRVGSPCANRQFGDGDVSFLQTAANLLFALVVGLPATLVTLVLFLACPCVCVTAGVVSDEGVLAFFGTVTSFVALALLVGAGVSLALPFIVAACVLYVLALAVYASLLCLWTYCTCGGGRGARAASAGVNTGDDDPELAEALRRSLRDLEAARPPPVPPRDAAAADGGPAVEG